MDKPTLDLCDDGAQLIFDAVKDVVWLDAWHAAEALVRAGWRPTAIDREANRG